MSYKQFSVKLDDDYPCPIVMYRCKESYCGHDDAMDPVTFKDKCSGNLIKKPKWCPLTEISTGKINEH